MRLRLLDRVRRLRRRAPATGRRLRGRADAAPGPTAPAGQAGTHRRVPPPRLPPADRGDLRGRASPGAARPGDPTAAALRPGDSTARALRPGDPAAGAAGPGPAGRHAGPLAGTGQARGSGPARAAVRTAPGAGDARQDSAAAQGRQATRARAARQPWYEIAQGNRTAAGRRHCGRLEEVLRRQWAEDSVPPAEVVTAIDRLAELPQLIKEKLVAGLDAIFVGPGGVPDLDDMGNLSGVPLPSGRATWDACGGAYGDRKIIIGSRPSPTPDVTCHEIGHALDDLDGLEGQWQSDSAEFLVLYDQCLPSVLSGFHKQRGVLGRREFFADSFAAIASSQRPALVDMLGGDTRAALNVMLYFNVRYGI